MNQGIPSRSEITDAAMGERAECVMLNKGPYTVTAVRMLADILKRMKPHHEKKRSMLRRLHPAASFASADQKLVTRVVASHCTIWMGHKALLAYQNG